MKILERDLAAKRRESARMIFKEFFATFRSFSRLNFLCIFAILISFIFPGGENCFAQTRKSNPKVLAKRIQTNSKKPVSNLPKVTRIDETALKNLIKPNGKPLLVNFWATWCVPCQEEFPDLVKIGADYKDKIDLVTISLDELSEIDGDVPNFLAEMKAETPGYLLKTADEEATIATVSKNWQGGLPFTILFNEKGETVYLKQGKFDSQILRTEIEKALSIQNRQVYNLPLSNCRPATLAKKKSP